MGLTIYRSGYVKPDQVRLVAASKRWVDDCSAAMLQELGARAPGGTSGKIYDYFNDTGQLMVGADLEFSALFGDIQELRVNRSAPRNTIAQFVAWYRKARKRGKARSPKRPWPYAWYYLTSQQKSMLEIQRRNRQFGGPHPPPTYMEAINSGAAVETLPPGTATYANMARFTGFLDRVKLATRSRVATISASVRV